MLELMILAYLNQGPQYGYQLMERLKSATSPIITGFIRCSGSFRSRDW